MKAKYKKSKPQKKNKSTPITNSDSNMIDLSIHVHVVLCKNK